MSAPIAVAIKGLVTETRLTRPMRNRIANAPTFDHGAALRVPPAHDGRGWRMIWTWLGEAGRSTDVVGVAEVLTPEGWTAAQPGDWLILTSAGRFHVTAGLGRPATA